MPPRQRRFRRCNKRWEIVRHVHGIYIFVLISHIKLQKEYGGNKILIIFNLIILLAVFAALIKYQWDTQKSAFYASIFTFIGAFIVEYIFRKYRKREIKGK